MADLSIAHALRACTKCGQSKPETTEFFYFQARRQFFEAACKGCRRKQFSANQVKPEVTEQRNAAYRARYADEPERFRAKRKGFYYRHREKEIAGVREWQAKYPERARQNSRNSAKAWREQNPEKDRVHQARKRKRLLATPKGRLDSRFRSRLGNYMRGGKGSRSWLSKVGYTLDELKVHIERQFMPGMSWDNMSEWHIDHIVPLSSFSYQSSDEEEFRAAWSLSNLRPLWADQNIRKGAQRTLLL